MSVLTTAQAIIATQQAGKEGTCTHMVGEQLKEMLRKEPELEELQKRLAEQAGRLEAEYNEKLRTERAAAEAKLQTVGNAAVQEFSVHFEIFQREYDTLLGACGRLQTDNRETADKLQGALAALLHRMAERLQTEENGEGSGNNATV